MNTFFVKAIPLLSPNTPVGTLGNNNFLAGYLAISMPFFFRKRWIYAAPFLALLVVVSKTSAAVIPMFIACAWYQWGWKGVAGAMVVGLGYATYDGAWNKLLNMAEGDRGYLWTQALKLIFISPLSVFFGHGPGSGWGRPYPMHNEWLQCWFHSGLS